MRAVIVGAGPNGLTAAARLAQRGWEVIVYERAYEVGGAASSQPLFGGCVADRGAACHPFGVASPAFAHLGLENYGLEWLRAPYEMAHPLDPQDAGVEAAFLAGSLAQTAAGLGRDAQAWARLHGSVVDHIGSHLDNVLAPLNRWPAHPLRLGRFGAVGMLPATALAAASFRTEKAKALFAGSAIHAIASPANLMTGAFGVLFGALGMSTGWPVAAGGTGAVTAALKHCAVSHGATVHCGVTISDLRELPEADAVILNVTPRQVLQMRGVELSKLRKLSLQRWRYGPAVYKVDFGLREPVPWRDPRVGQAATVHVGGSVADLVQAERAVARGVLPQRPFVMVCQQFVADQSRGLVLWTYAHVPHGYTQRYPGEVRERIQGQLERFAPGFGEVVTHVHETSPAELEAWNPNLVGGDIAGGAMTGLQMLLRLPYRLRRGLYLASASTAPGAGVHGMPGWWAAEAAIRDFE